MEIKAIIWDWDGTLIDSYYACYKASKEIFLHFGIEISCEEYTKNFVPNWYKMYERFGLKKEYWEIADKLWYKYFDHSSVNWREGALENLEYIKSKGIRQGVVTASTRKDIEKEAIYLKPERFIDHFLCWDDCQKTKPEPEPLLNILEILDVSPENSVYIGDTAEDIKMGKMANVLTIGISSLFNKKEDLLRENPDYFFNDLFELLNFWKTIL
jgi:HAD superfamily hydrolase (TIGR01549 family)